MFLLAKTSTTNTMTEEEFEYKMQLHQLDAEYSAFITDRFDAYSKAKMLWIMESGDAYDDFKDHMVCSIYNTNA
jgi:hypothetical protein